MVEDSRLALKITEHRSVGNMARASLHYLQAEVVFALCFFWGHRRLSGKSVLPEHPAIVIAIIILSSMPAD